MAIKTMNLYIFSYIFHSARAENGWWLLNPRFRPELQIYDSFRAESNHLTDVNKNETGCILIISGFIRKMKADILHPRKCRNMNNSGNKRRQKTNRDGEPPASQKQSIGGLNKLLWNLLIYSV